MTKLIVALRNFVNAPKNWLQLRDEFIVVGIRSAESYHIDNTMHQYCSLMLRKEVTAAPVGRVIILGFSQDVKKNAERLFFCRDHIRPSIRH